MAIHAVMSQKFGFACNDGDAPGGGRREEDGQAADVLIKINQLYEITPKQLLIIIRCTVGNIQKPVPT